MPLPPVLEALAATCKRIVFVVLGYLAGLAAGAAALPVMLLVISIFNPSSELWQWLGLGPIAIAVAPVIFFFVMWMVMVLTVIPAAVLIFITEIFGLRQIWLHVLVSLLLAAVAGLSLVPDWFFGMSLNRWLITLAVAISALVAGLVYWAIAGRRAGFRSTGLTAPPVPS
jgi:hypothetical protein